VAKTLYLLSYIDDETYRRRILTQLNRGEGRHGLARTVLHGQRAMSGNATARARRNSWGR
jgi:TnpA family transposase